MFGAPSSSTPSSEETMEADGSNSSSNLFGSAGTAGFKIYAYNNPARQIQGLRAAPQIANKQMIG